MITVRPERIRDWCLRELGAEPQQSRVLANHLSLVTAIELSDGRQIVVKGRPTSPRLLACTQVQRSLASANFPCPMPIVGPTPMDDLAISAEQFVAGGELLEPGPDSPRLFAQALARLVAMAPDPDQLNASLAPPPSWVWWNHDQQGVWPPPDDRDDDLNARTEPRWLARFAERARARLAASRLPEVVGHVDWESQNLRWIDRKLHAVHDWDSTSAMPEAFIAGAAATMFPTAGPTLAAASVMASESFLAAYEDARGRRWTDEEREVCWAAGLWPLLYNAKKESMDAAIGPVQTTAAEQSESRLARAGA